MLVVELKSKSQKYGEEGATNGAICFLRVSVDESIIFRHQFVL